MDYDLLDDSFPSYFSGFCSPGSNGADAICRDVWTLRDTKISRLHFHNCIEIAYCVQGTGLFYLDKRVYHYGPGDMQIVFPYQPHYSIADENVQCVWKYMYVDPYKLALKTKGLSVVAFRELLMDKIQAFGLFKKDEHPEMHNIVMRFESSINNLGRYRDELCATLLYELLLYMADIDIEGERTVSRISKGNRGCIYGAVEKINLRVRNDGAVNMRVEELAQEYNMSTSNFRVLFKSVTGFSPKEYITNVRLNYAEHLLLDTDYSIQVVSEMAGFSTPASFHDKFLKVYGVTPKKYRDAAL